MSPVQTEQSHREKKILELKGVSKDFGGIRAVDKVSFGLEDGKITCLIGPNGAGKTTLFNLISGFLAPDEGEILFHSRRITGKPPYAIVRLGVARSFQNLRVFGRLTALENVTLAGPNQAGEKILHALFDIRSRCREKERQNQDKALSLLRFVGLADKASQLAGGLAYPEQKLLILARVLAAEPELILLDEPAAGLDPLSLKQFLELIRTLIQEGKTICIVEHNLDVVRDLSDHCIFLSQGRIVLEGSVSQIEANRELAGLYFGR